MAQCNSQPGRANLSSDTTSMASGSEKYFDETLHKYMLARIEADPEGFLEQWNAYYKSVEKWCSKLVSIDILDDDMCDIDDGWKCNNGGAVEDPKDDVTITTNEDHYDLLEQSGSGELQYIAVEQVGNSYDGGDYERKMNATTGIKDTYTTSATLMRICWETMNIYGQKCYWVVFDRGK